MTQEIAIQKLEEAVEAIRQLPHKTEPGNPPAMDARGYSIESQERRNADALGRAEYALGMLRPVARA